MTRAEPSSSNPAAPSGDVAQTVVARADELACHRDAPCVGTVDLLFALFEVYDRLIDRALYLRGASRVELLERLATVDCAVETGH